MKLAVSSIAWTNEEEPAVAQKLQELGVKYVEIAPTKLWDEPIDATPEQISEYVEFWKGYGIEIVAFQSMLFSHPEMKIFEDEENRKATESYLQSFTRLAGDMGAKVLVFGSPKNRQRGDMAYDTAFTLAESFFKNVGAVARDNNTSFCIEPNPTVYACDFVTTAQEGIDLVEKANEPGFRLHLDIAGMTLAGDDVQASIEAAAPLLTHFHMSAPQLGQVEDRDDVDYRGAVAALEKINYQGFASIEMRPGDPGTNVERVEKAVRFLQSL